MRSRILLLLLVGAMATAGESAATSGDARRAPANVAANAFAASPTATDPIALLKSALAGTTVDPMVIRRGESVSGGTPETGQPTTVAGAGTVTLAGHGASAALTGTYCTRTGTTRACRTYRDGRLTAYCVVQSTRTTCTYYNASGRPYRRCVTENGRTTCTQLSRSFFATPARAPAAPVVSAVSSLQWHGWLNQVMLTVGRIVAVYPLADGRILTSLCSGTVVTRTLVVTAAHCVYSAANGGYAKEIYFYPGQTWGDAADPQSVRLPLGYWQANNWWAPDGYRFQGDGGLDYGLIEIGPAADGWLSDYTRGAWTWTANLRYQALARQYIVGYPSAGFWETARGYHGRGQYGCDTNYDPAAGSETERIGSGYLMWSRCFMNRGSSGGPWFVAMSNGSWTIGAVSSQCSGRDMTPLNYCNPWADYIRGAYFNENFQAFWNGVQRQLRWR